MINRGNGRAEVLHADGDYQAFVTVLKEASQRVPNKRKIALPLTRERFAAHWTLLMKQKLRRFWMAGYLSDEGESAKRPFCDGKVFTSHSTGVTFKFTVVA